ncbi:DUF839 domain-containing protein [Aliiglaciecola sp.]|nr:DUF839 domain-containing protein [Aliiglaciecola sp.]
MVTRRQFNKGMVSTALSGLAFNLQADALFKQHIMPNVGPLVPDPSGILDLPAGFSYKVISKLGDSMIDGLKVPDRADGMGCIALDSERVALIRNHELQPKHKAAKDVEYTPEQIAKSYDLDADGSPVTGGTSTLIYNLKTQKTERQFMSLIGTIRNCSGGTTPWGSWLTCEESVDTPSKEISKDHGYVFEVPANATGLVDPNPIKAMGRFNHEAACVDPVSGFVYLTEDRNNSLFYRFIPKDKHSLHHGGQLQALVIKGQPQFDTRNWSSNQMQKQVSYECEWINLDNVESPLDDLRTRGYAKGAALFARGEGIHFADKELYFCCTSGGAKKLGQIMRYSVTTETPTISLFLESEHSATYNYGDNVCIAPNGHLVVCEDQYSDMVNNHLKGITTKGEAYDIAKIRWQTEPAGACFSPDGKTMFVNLYSPTTTLAISGPWDTLDG